MQKRYSAARPVSDPVASRNATLKMIRLCAKYQTQAEEFGQASHTDDYSHYTAWGVRAEEDGPISPAIAIKEVNDMVISRKLFPTRPVALVPTDWYYLNGQWAYYTSPFAGVTWTLPPDVQWFTMRPLDPAANPLEPSPPITAREIEARWHEARRYSAAQLEENLRRMLREQFAMPPELIERITRQAPVLRGNEPTSITISEA